MQLIGMGPSCQTVQDDYEDEACFFDTQPYKVKEKEKDWLQYSSIGALICHYQISQYKGTGYLVRPRVVVTAAHNIYDKKLGLRKNIRFFPKAFGNLTQGIRVIDAKVCEEYKQGRKQICFDIAFCLLEQSVNEDYCIDIGYNFDINASKITSAQALHIFGYPGCKWDKTSAIASQYNYSVELRGIQVPSTVFTKYIKKTDLQNGNMQHFISTQEGQSGAPIIAEVDNRFYAIGMVKGSKSIMKKPVYNVGLLFNKIFIRRLKEFLQSHYLGHMFVYNFSTFQWNKQTQSVIGGFETQGKTLIRSSEQEDTCSIQSQNLQSLVSWEEVLKLRLTHFHYGCNDTKIELVVKIQKGFQRQEVSYITYNHNREGKIKSGYSFLHKEFENDLFIGKDQFLELTVNLAKGQVSFWKGSNRKYPVKIGKQLVGAQIYLLARMNSQGDAFEVDSVIQEI